MSREDPHFRLRLPETLKAQVEEAAAKNHRSMTGEIVARLEATFSGQPDDRISEILSLLKNGK